jgi:hypothetical protein
VNLQPGDLEFVVKAIIGGIVIILGGYRLIGYLDGRANRAQSRQNIVVRYADTEAGETR